MQVINQVSFLMMLNQPKLTMSQHLNQQSQAQLYIPKLLGAGIPCRQQRSEHDTPFLPAICFGYAFKEAEELSVHRIRDLKNT
jgi:hypothetical protein